MSCKHNNCCKQSECKLAEPEKHIATPVDGGTLHVDTYPACHTRSGLHGNLHETLPEHAMLVISKKKSQAA